MALLVVSSDAGFQFLQLREITRALPSDVLLTNQMCFGTIKDEREFVPQLYFTDFNYLGKISTLFTEVKNQLRDMDLTLAVNNSSLDLTDAVVSDLSYQILRRLIIAEKVLELHETNRYSSIVFLNDGDLYENLTEVLEQLGMPVKLYPERRKESIKRFLLGERISFLAKSLLFRSTSTSVATGKHTYLAYMSTSYYAEKFALSMAKSDPGIVFGVTSNEQLKARSRTAQSTLLSWRAATVSLRSVPKNKSDKERSRESTLVFLFAQQLLPSLYIKAQLLVHSYVRTVPAIAPNVILITMPSFLDSACLILVARTLKIPTVLLNAGALTIIDQYLIPQVDRYFVWGEYYKQLLLEKGVAASTIEVTGTPFQEKMKGNEAKISPISRIGVASTGFPQGAGNIYWKVIADGLKSLKIRYEIIIRSHPLENSDEFNAMLINWFGGVPYRLDSRRPVAEFLADCDLVIHQSSTVGIEAIIAGMPAIDVDPFGLNRNAPFDCFTIPVKAKNGAALTHAIEYYGESNGWHASFLAERQIFMNSLFTAVGNEAGENVARQLRVVPRTL